jgi:hypothetical protein
MFYKVQQLQLDSSGRETKTARVGTIRSRTTQPRQRPTIGARWTGKGGEVTIAGRGNPLVVADAAIGARVRTTDGHRQGRGS